MAVTVIIGNPNTQSGKTQHADGADIDIRDGHLVVLSAAPSKRVAIYAPGSWKSAQIAK
jgi:hypothetical protein